MIEISEFFVHMKILLVDNSIFIADIGPLYVFELISVYVDMLHIFRTESYPVVTKKD
jgi:hypothetical protein